MNVLLGWELGGGQGHIQRLVQLAQILETQGYNPVFALKSYHLQGRTLPGQCLLAPRLPFSGRETSHSFGDILASFGFDQAPLLKHHIQAWQEILRTVKPRLVIADHAPGLVLAAYQRVPTIVIGSHFAVPPPVEEFPIFRFPAPPETFERQQQVSQTIRQVVPLNATLGEVLTGDRHFIFSIPQLDCYRVWRQNPEYVGIQSAPIVLSPMQENPSPWAYLTDDYPDRDLVINTLHPRTEFLPLGQALSNTSIAIHHGGLTTTIGCLLAGIPQLILPRHLEQQLTAFSLQSLGVAEMLTSPSWESLWLLQTQLQQRSRQAQNLAQTLSPWNHNLVEKVVHACLQMA